MTSLTQKRYLAKQAVHDSRYHTTEVDGVNHLKGSETATLVGGATFLSTSIDIGIHSGIYTFQWGGTESVNHLDYTLMVSNDNITFHPYHTAVALKIGGTISLSYDIGFRYHKLKIVNTDASLSGSIDLIYSGRH